jgi:hypothetical protein
VCSYVDYADLAVLLERVVVVLCTLYTDSYLNGPVIPASFILRFLCPDAAGHYLRMNRSRNSTRRKQSDKHRQSVKEQLIALANLLRNLFIKSHKLLTRERDNTTNFKTPVAHSFRFFVIFFTILVNLDDPEVVQRTYAQVLLKAPDDMRVHVQAWDPSARWFLPSVSQNALPQRISSQPPPVSTPPPATPPAPIPMRVSESKYLNKSTSTRPEPRNLMMSASPIVVGKRVELHSLQTVSLNGAVGTVVSILATDGRVAVDLGAGIGLKSIKIANLRDLTVKKKLNAGAQIFQPSKSPNQLVTNVFVCTLDEVESFFNFCAVRVAG